MKSMMSQMCTGNDLQRIGAQIDYKINEVSAKVDSMGTKVNNIDEKVNQTNHRVVTMEEKLNDMRRDIDNDKKQQISPPPMTTRPPRRSAGASSATSAASSSAAAPTNDRFPRVIHFRGWSPYGAGQHQLTKAAAKEPQEDITQCLQRNATSVVGGRGPSASCGWGEMLK